MRAIIDGGYSSSDESRRLRRHQLPPTDPPVSPEDSEEEAPEELPPEEPLPESLESLDELSGDVAAGSGAGVRSRAGSGVELLDDESLEVDSVVSLAPFEESFDEDLREIGRRRR